MFDNSKMFKLNKTTHMMILMTFTIVFVVVYIYYVIRDVKKIHGDVKKQSVEITGLASEIQEIKSVVSGMLASPPPLQMMPMPVPVPMPTPAPVKVPVAVAVAVAVEKDEDEEEDVASVATDDIKKLVEDEEEPEAEAGEEADTEVASADAFTEEQLKKLKLDEIKEICKNLGVNAKGNRDVLIARILEHK